MKKILATITLLILAFAACRKSDSSSSNDFSLLHPDQKDEAAKIVDSANQELKKVKVIYKANQNKVDEIKAAIQGKDVEKVKTISNDLVAQINDGIETANDAVKKIQDAEDMDINDTYKNYFSLKRRALEKQIQAFELRRQVAFLLNKNFGSKDPAQIDKVQAEFRNKEDECQKLMDDAKDLSEEANQVYKDSLKKN